KEKKKCGAQLACFMRGPSRNTNLRSRDPLSIQKGKHNIARNKKSGRAKKKKQKNNNQKLFFFNYGGQTGSEIELKSRPLVSHQEKEER
ncbi:hypothetical protein IscW_ISCW019081, partial [Ixodes scapularis]